MENEVLVCEGARVLLTQNLWVEAGLMNGALGKVVGYMWPQDADPHHPDRKDLRVPAAAWLRRISGKGGVPPAPAPLPYRPTTVTARWCRARCAAPSRPHPRVPVPPPPPPRPVGVLWTAVSVSL